MTQPPTPRNKPNGECRAGDAVGGQRFRDACDLLLVANRDNPKALGDFGYAVNDSPEAKAIPALKARVSPHSCLPRVLPGGAE
jgi:hypothetical protein